MRKWTYLVAALLMAGATTTFTGCIDNDEPGSIEVLRTAKAELLRAKIAVETANAALINAQATAKLADAKIAEAQAAFVSAQAAQEQAKAEAEAAKTEEEKARVEAAIAEYQQQMEKALLQHQTNMVKKQQALAEAQANYRLALKEIEIAETLVTGEAQTTLETLKGNVTAAYEKIYGDGEKEGLVDEVYAKEKALYTAQLDKLQGGEDQTNWIPGLELKVTRAEGDLAAAETKVQKLEEFLEKDVTTADWRGEIAELEDSIEGLKLAMTEYDVEIKRIETSDEYRAAKAAKEETAEAAKKTVLKVGAYEHKYSDIIKGADVLGLEANFKADKANYNEVTGKIKAEIKKVQDALAIFTAEREAMWEEQIAGSSLEQDKKKMDDAIAAWENAKAIYDKVKADGFNLATYQEKTLNVAIKKQVEIIGTQQAIADANVADAVKKAAEAAINGAKQEIAKALLAYVETVGTYGETELAKLELKYYELVGNKAEEKTAEKTIVEWFSDSVNLVSYLDQLVGEYTEGNVQNVYKNLIFSSMTVGEDYKQVLVAASETAFGTYFLVDNEGYMRVIPTEADQVACYKADKWEEGGALMRYYAANEDATSGLTQNYKTVKEDLNKALEALNGFKKDADTILADAEAKYDEAKAAFDAENAEVDKLNAEKKVIDARKGALDELRETLVEAVNKHLGLNGPEYTPDTESFEEALKESLEAAEDEVIEAQKKLASAERQLKEAQEGKYDAVAEAQKDLDEANAKLEAAQAEYEKALKDLETGLAIMAGKAE